MLNQDQTNRRDVEVNGAAEARRTRRRRGGHEDTFCSFFVSFVSSWLIFGRRPKMQKSIIHLLSLFAFTPLLALSATVNAQTATATLKGAALDAGGAAVPGAVVTLTNTSTNLKKTFTTGEGGHFTFTFIEPGFYALDAKADGFKTYHQPRLQLEVGQALELNIRLAPGDVRETVNIVATEPTGLDTATSS